MQYTVTIPDEREQCITAAREAYNSTQPQTVPLDPPNPEDPSATMPNPALKVDNAAYMAWVMDNATVSYCNQYFPAPPPAPASAP